MNTPAKIAALLLLGLSSSLQSMTLNLAVPFQTKPSPPRSADLNFYAPGCENFLFSTDHPPRIVCAPYLRALSVEWHLSHNRVQTPLVSGSMLTRFDNSFPLEVPTKQLSPGFYDLRVKVKLSDTQFLEGVTTFGWQADKMKLHPVCPADFDAFWKTAVKKLDAIPPQTQCNLEMKLSGKEIDAYNTKSAALPENYDPEGNKYDAVEVYRVRFASYGGKTIEGWYAKPVGGGPFPCILVLPGAGNNARPAPVEHARHGYAALDIQVHGNPVDAGSYAKVPQESLTPDHPEEFIHYGVYLNALQAARVLKQLPGANADKLSVLGGSQGGRLTLVVAALDPTVKAAIPAITHYSYLPWLYWTQRLNNEKQPGADGFTSDTPEAKDIHRADSYIDVLNFAPRIHCPVLMNCGLIDPVSAPTGVFAAYQLMPGKKQIIPLPNLGHDWSPAFDRYAWRWLERTLNTAPASKK